MFSRTHAQASPSVTLEKGIARLQPVRPRRPPRSSRHEGPESILPTASERKAAALLATLAFTTLISVCLVLYLLSRKSRWELSSPLPFATHSELLRSSSSALIDGLNITPLSTPRMPVVAHKHDNDPFNQFLPSPSIGKSSASSERYLSYLPHSGFHNQRIALENALILSYILNRTLLIPPVLLGDLPLRYRPFVNLHIDVALSTKLGLQHCALVPEGSYIPEECSDFWTHTAVFWDWFVDLKTVTEKYGIRTLKRWDLGDAFLVRLGINSGLSTKGSTYLYNDTDPYEYRFFDSPNDARPLGTRYKVRVDLPLVDELARGHRLLQFGTLFGTGRIRLLNPVHLALRGDVRRAMVLRNPELLAIADDIRDTRELGGSWSYAAVHLRLGDGVFADEAARLHNVRLIWWRLVRELGMKDEDALIIEESLRRGRGSDAPALLRPPPRVQDATSLRSPHPPLPPFELLNSSSRSHGCQKKASHPLLTVPLYMATDKPGYRALSVFTDTFPCVYVLSDFSIQVARLNRLTASSLRSTPLFHSLEDEVPLAPFLPPFLDAIVASKARIIVGTPGSTFSAFVEDVLWRAYRGWDIVQRG